MPESDLGDKKTSTRKLDEEICLLLKTVADHFYREDRMTRERQIRHWRRLKLYWNNFSLIYWSEAARDYRTYTRDANTDDTDQDYYDKPANVFKAFLETIIAAMSVQIPGVSCVPDDADNPLDCATAKAGDEIADLLYKHNDVMFLWLHALYIHCTEGMIACRTYKHESEDYGTYNKPKYGKEEIEAYACPHCGARVPDEEFSKDEMDEFNPSDDDAKLHDEIKKNGPVCIECGIELDPELQKSKLVIPRLVGTTKHPKSRICMEVYGGLYVKVANYAKAQKGTPYLIFSHETHYANAMECYPEVREKLPQGEWSSYGVDDPYEQYGRLNTQYRGEFPEENVTIKECWLRPAAFNVLPDEDYEKLSKKFPDGACVTFVNEVCAEYKNQCLDDEWTLTENPMMDFLNQDPLGELLTNIQDIVNDLISLTLQTIEHGIAQTFADPALVNFNAQKQLEAQPGTLTPLKQISGTKNVGEGFFTLKQATLAPEVLNFYKIIQELGQFVSGALPSIFGGQLPSGSSRTASEYTTSKGMALQRLQTPWRMMLIWWKKIFGKAIPMYMKCIKDMGVDEKIVKKTDRGNFINVFIRQAELDGRIGDIELEADDRLPITDEQQADMIMQLFQLNNQEITAALMDPENLPFIAKVIKIPQFRLPGEDDRQKQYEEINELINTAPIPPTQQDIALYQQAKAANPNAAQQPQEEPSVQIDVDVDNHSIEAGICKEWLISSAGRLAKVENPDGYKNVLLHMKAHLSEVQKGIMAQRMHDDQLTLATSKEVRKPSGSEVSKSLPKPKTPEKVGEQNATAE